MSAKNIGDNIRWRREAKGMTQQELGNRCGVSDAMVCFYERGQRMPSLPTAAALADALGCTVDELLGRSATA